MTQKNLCGFPGYKPVPPGWFKICVGFITGTESGFMEKQGMEPATPGLQGIGLTHTPRRLTVLTHWLRNKNINAELKPLTWFAHKMSNIFCLYNIYYIN